MYRKWVLGMALVAMATFAVPKVSAADAFALNVDFCTNPCLAAGGTGTVTLTQVSSTSVQFDVVLTGDLHFHQTEGLDAFMFNYSGTGALSFSNITSGFGTVFGPKHEDGAGTFDYILPYGTQPAVDGQTLSFLVSDGTLNITDFETVSSGGDPSVDFAANVSAGGGVCTGLIGGGNGTGPSTPATNGTGEDCGGGGSVPEPASVLLLGTVLAFVGKFFRGRLAAA